MKKYIAIFTILIFITSCVTTKNANTKTLKLTNAASQRYTLGTNTNTGKTTGNTFSMFFESKGDIKIDKVWINGTNIDFEQVATNAEGSFRVRSTFYDVFKNNLHKNIKAPIEYEGQGLVQYTENGETKYYIVSEFKKVAKVSGYK